MERAVPQLVNEYNNESFGISDINELAELCNKKGNCSEPLLTAGRSQRSQQKQLSKLHKR